MYTNKTQVRKILTKNINLETACGSISSLIISNISNVVCSPQEALSWTVATALHYVTDSNVVTELWLVPRYNSRAIACHNPKVTRAVFNSWWNLVNNQLLATRPTVSQWAHSLSTVGGHKALNSSNRILITSPSKHQTTVQNRLCSTVANLREFLRILLFLMFNFIRKEKAGTWFLPAFGFHWLHPELFPKLAP